MMISDHRVRDPPARIVEMPCRDPRCRFDWNVEDVIREHVEVQESILYTDEAKSYKAIGTEFTDHIAVNHSWGEYVRNGASTNKAENYFSQLKRSLDGTHHSVSPEHLPRYLQEFDYRYTTCKLSDTERTMRLFGKVAGRRLTYRETR